VAAASLEERLRGRTIAGRYRIREAMASGAFGTVFRAEQYFCNQFMRPVAVKVSRQAGLTEETAPSLFSDAITLAQLLASGEQDEGLLHLVQIFDLGLLPEYDDRAYMAMEYVEGLPLLTHLNAAGTLSVATGLRYVKQICRAVQVVHRQGAAHRDLKADNILVDRRGVVRVVDFGLAAFTDPTLGYIPGSMGTFMYMAPETLLGRSTPASDVYSLGLVMYEIFTGGGPHLTAPWGSDGEARRDENHRLKTGLVFDPPSRTQNEIRFDYRWLDGLISRCLHADPACRFATAGELLQAIQACEAGEELPPTPASAVPLPEAPGRDDEATEALFREVRRLLGSRRFAEVIDKLDVHRPAEWAVVDKMGARTLRALGAAYLGVDDLANARECLEQLRTVQKAQRLLAASDYAAALSDLVKCYRALGLEELALQTQQEARGLL